MLFVDDILLVSKDMAFLLETKSFLSKNFEIKDLGDVSFVIGIQIQRDRTRGRGILSLSQKTYIDKVLHRYSMKNYSLGDTPLTKRNKLSLLQCPKNDLQKEQMKGILYALAVENLIYAQVYTRPDIAYTVEKLDRYLINPGIDHWKTAKKVMKYLQKTT